MKHVLFLTATTALLLPATLMADDNNPTDKSQQVKPQKAKPKVIRQKIRVQVQPKAGKGRAVQVRQLRPIGFAAGYSGPNKLYLLRRPDVQKELKLDEDQQKEVQEALQELNKKRQEAYAKLRQAGANIQNRIKEYRKLNQKINEEADKKAAEILQPVQLERLNQITVQMQGLRALQNPEVVNKLKLTKDQQEKIAEIQAGNLKQRRKLFQDVRNGNLERGKLREKMNELQKDIEEKTLDVLTPEQQAQFRKMKGKKFEMKNQGRAIRAIPGQIRIQINGKKIKNIQIRRIPAQPKPVRPKKAGK